MYKKFYFSVVFLMVFFFTGFAQQYLAGKILKKGSPDIVPGVNIKNMSNNKYNTSDMGGNYRIIVQAGDTLIFSSAGYRPDTITANGSMLVNEYDIYLTSNIMALAVVEVDALSKYESDSIRRTEEYAYILNPKNRAKLVKTKKVSSDRPGFTFSPIAFFSKREKQKRKLLERIKQEDENEYIDVRFPRSRVAQVTGLTGDSLQRFMLLYRPGYDFCRKATSQDILLYINDKLILFRKGQNEKR
jgi:CarboxypepD_reg-like domain